MTSVLRLDRGEREEHTRPVWVVLGLSTVKVVFEGTGVAKPMRMEAKRVTRIVREDMVEGKGGVWGVTKDREI